MPWIRARGKYAWQPKASERPKATSRGSLHWQNFSLALEIYVNNRDYIDRHDLESSNRYTSISRQVTVILVTNAMEIVVTA